MTTIKTKQCSRCNITKPILDFGKNKCNKDLHQYYCKECGCKSSANWRETANKDKLNEYAKDYYKANKSRWKDYAKAAKPYVYKITNKITKDYYIGCSGAKFEARICRHFISKDYNNSPFRGENKDDYEFTILCFTKDKIKAREVEKQLLKARVGIDSNCLNIYVGGK